MQISGQIERISGQKMKQILTAYEIKKSLKPLILLGFKDFLCGTLEGIRTPDLLVRSQREIPILPLFEHHLGVFSPCITPYFSIISMYY